MTTNLEVSWDDARGAVLVKQNGPWQAGEMREILPRIAPLLERSRTRNGGALMLVDMGELPLEAVAAMGSARGAASSTLREGDRVALIVATNLAKSHLGKIGSSVLTYGLFVSRSAAETWLFAHRQALSA